MPGIDNISSFDFLFGLDIFKIIFCSIKFKNLEP